MLRCSPPYNRPDAGVTLVELMVALVVAGILMVGVGSLVLVATETSAVANRRLALERHAHYATTLVQRRVRAKSFAEVSIGQDGNALVLNPGGAAQESFYLQGRDMIWEHADGTETLVEGAADSLAFSLEEGHIAGRYLLRITLQVSDENQVLEIEDIAAMRN